MDALGSEIDVAVVDDSGLLSLVDCNTYSSFLSEDWTYESILEHFSDQMSKRSILVWECGDGGGAYSISIRRKLTKLQGFREATGAILATGDRLQIVSYDALTMAAQFADEVLPSKHELNLAVPVVPGPYAARIVQMVDPDRISETPAPHFVIELEARDAPAWSSVAWLRG